jgi:hypothetical protein
MHLLCSFKKKQQFEYILCCLASTSTANLKHGGSFSQLTLLDFDKPGCSPNFTLNLETTVGRARVGRHGVGWQARPELVEGA